MAVLMVQPVTGTFGMNVKVPKNGHEAGRPFYVFGIIICVEAVVLTGYLLLVRWWWRTAKRRRGNVLAEL
jgi:magnesium transporter